MGQEASPAARIPSATYRLQFNSQFTFEDAREIVGYLNELGISDVYASSYLAAKAGSVHGYDVVNQTILNREIGDEGSYQALMDELQRLGMGHILDFVPNHMCIESAENLWWMDVLENGESSPYARFFDIEWTPVKKELKSKVLLPFLGDQYGKVLEKGELHLVFQEGAFFIECPGVRIPVEPKSYLQILEHRVDALNEHFSQEDLPLLELLSIMTALQHLPPHNELDAEKQGERHREKEIIKKRLANLYRDTPQIAAFIDQNVTIFNGTKGDAKSFDLLDTLLRYQVYRLSYWRVATEEINYRRFFDINSLAAIRMEDAAVFDTTHQLLFRLIKEGRVTGVRIDHVDGLYDPLGYLQKLQQSCYLQLRQGSEGGLPESAEEKEKVLEQWSGDYRDALEKDPSYKPFYAVVEKILLKGEQLPEQWPVYGTTGYEFMNAVNGIFVDTENAKVFDRIYSRLVGMVADFMDIVYEKKKLVMQVSMSGEGNMLAHQLNTISEEDRRTRDFTLNSLARAIGEVIACFPVYRTYANSASVRDRDIQYIDVAVSKAKRKNPAVNASIFDFVRDVLLLRAPSQASENERMAWLAFAMRFQQITGPVTAKGLEDTAFYVYNRLVSLNEVGGMPGRFGTTLEAFHGQNLDRVKNFPHGMIATATHDSKRGEDVRTRIDALSEMPELWQKSVARWRRMNRSKRGLLEGLTVPDRNEEYLLYQMLIGAWPAGETDPEGYERFCNRIKDYMIKAIREAKINTSWVSPNGPYEEAVVTFVDRILCDPHGNAFLGELFRFQKRIARCGMFSSLSQVLLKMTSPGMPDFYQGSELWELSLVDPDNRRPVDYRIRKEALAAVKGREAEVGAKALFSELLEKNADGRVKLYLIYRVLNYRKARRKLFDEGDYHPLEARGLKARHVCAFSRVANGSSVIVVVPRLLAGLVPEEGGAPMGEEAWGDTVLPLPQGSARRFRNVVNDEEIEAAERDGQAVLVLAQVLSAAPVALLEALG